MLSLNISRPVPQYQFANWMDEIAIHFSKMLKVNNGLVELHMQKYEMRDYGAQWFSENLIYNRKLVHLDLSWYLFTTTKTFQEITKTFLN